MDGSQCLKILYEIKTNLVVLKEGMGKRENIAGYGLTNNFTIKQEIDCLKDAIKAYTYYSRRFKL